jgi:hypothetical protein
MFVVAVDCAIERATRSARTFCLKARIDTVTPAADVLLSSCGSIVLVAIDAVLVIVPVSGRFMRTANVKTAVAPRGSVAVVQLAGPAAPTAGVLHVNAVPNT